MPSAKWNLTGSAWQREGNWKRENNQFPCTGQSGPGLQVWDDTDAPLSVCLGEKSRARQTPELVGPVSPEDCYALLSPKAPQSLLQLCFSSQAFSSSLLSRMEPLFADLNFSAFQNPTSTGPTNSPSGPSGAIPSCSQQTAFGHPLCVRPWETGYDNI